MANSISVQANFNYSQTQDLTRATSCMANSISVQVNYNYSQTQFYTTDRELLVNLD